VRLEQIAEEYGDEVEIEWRSFLLRPEPEPRDAAKFTEYTKSWQRPASMEAEAAFTTPWSSDDAPPSHSMPSAIAGKVAETFGPEIFDRFHELLLKAYFTENRTISDPEVLAQVAEAAGIDPEQWAERMAPDPHPLFNEVAQDHNQAIKSGVTGVPAVVVDDKYLIGGAVDVEHYREVIEHSKAERQEQADQA